MAISIWGKSLGTATPLIIVISPFSNKGGCDCVFEIHDSAVYRNPIDLENANRIMQDILKEMLDELELDWEIPDDAQLVKCKELELRHRKITNDSRDEVDRTDIDLKVDLPNPNIQQTVGI